MNLVRVAVGVLNQTPLDWEGNRSNILDALARTKEQGASILCLPELCITGYGCEDALLAPNTHRTAWAMLEDIVPATRGLIVCLGLPIQYNNVVFNAACLAVDGQIAGFTAKRYLAADGIHYEPRWFKPWPVGRRVEFRVKSESYPLGDFYFDCGGVRLGFEICEDAWAADRPGGNMFLKGVDVILNPSASHFAFGKQEIRRRFVLEGSRAFGVTYLYSNLVGNEAGRAIYDGGGLIATNGKMTREGARFSYSESSVVSCVVDLDLTRMNQARSASASVAPDGASSDCLRLPFEFPVCDPTPTLQPETSWENSAHLKEEEFSRAVALGLFDYLRKSRSQGFVVSLSGGADSSAVSILVHLMCRFAIQGLGLEGAKEKLSYIERVSQAKDARTLTGALLSCVYQSTRNSSQTTRDAARLVATSIGASYYEFDVDQLVDSYTEIVSKSIGRDLNWATDDLALQNIQARVRAPSVWLLANLQDALLLATSNRSEAAVGYATMDGDTAGGLSPIAGIDKAFLRRWLVWAETDGPEQSYPLSALASVNCQQPTAELRPSGSLQTDETDLMPYDVLDAIERSAIRDRRAPMGVFGEIRVNFPEHAAAQLGEWVERFFKLWSRNQWKRERYAPSFHLDDENLDPKTWCRFPILSGGFELELTRLREYLDTLEKAPVPVESDTGEP